MSSSEQLHIGQDREKQVCCRCVMDTTAEEIVFDEQGICNFCKEYFEREPGIVFSGEDGKYQLNKAINQIKRDGKGKEYDCLIGVSGGVDSTYVAYLAKKVCGLRPLAVHFDNGWNSELAVQNIQNVLEVLDIDLYTYVVDWEEFKDLQLSFLKASVANAEIPTDHGFLATLYEIALKHNINYIITGSNFRSEGILPDSFGYLSVDLKHIMAIQKIFGLMPLKTYPKLSLTKYIYSTFVKNIKKVPILNYVDYNLKEAMEVIERELGWKYYGGKHYESIFTRFFQSYILPKKFGFDKRIAHYSTLICSGQMTREEALDRLKHPPCPIDLMEQDKEYVIKKLGITKKEFEDIMHLPVKKFSDYPNNSKIFSLLYNLNEFRNKLKSKKKQPLTENIPSKINNSKEDMSSKNIANLR